MRTFQTETTFAINGRHSLTVDLGYKDECNGGVTIRDGNGDSLRATGLSRDSIHQMVLGILSSYRYREETEGGRNFAEAIQRDTARMLEEWDRAKAKKEETV